MVLAYSTKRPIHLIHLAGALFICALAFPAKALAGAAVPPPPVTGDIGKPTLPPPSSGKVDPLRSGPQMSPKEARLSRQRCEQAAHIVKTANAFSDESPLAVRYYQQALDLCPGHSEAHFRMGVISYHKKQVDPAIKSLERATKSNPGFGDGYYNLGIIYRQRKDGKKAKKFFTYAAKSNPGDALALYNLGVLEYLSLDRLAAQVSFKNAIASDPKLAEPHFFLGAMYQEQGERQSAKKELKTAIRLNPELALPRVFLSAILETEGNNRDAQSELDKAISINPSSVNVGYGLEDFYFNEGKSNVILTHIRKPKKKRIFKAAAAIPAQKMDAPRERAGLPGGSMGKGVEAKEEFGAKSEAKEIPIIAARAAPPAEDSEPEAMEEESGPGNYRIRPGDTLGRVAKRFGTTFAVLMGLNHNRIEHPSMLEVGDVIRVPEKPTIKKKRRPRRKKRALRKGRKRRTKRAARISKKRGKKAGLPRRGSVALYRIKRGDTLSKIARRFKTDSKTIMALNRSRIEHPAFLEVGMKIRVPASGKKKRRKKAARKKTRKKSAPAN